MYSTACAHACVLAHDLRDKARNVIAAVACVRQEGRGPSGGKLCALVTLHGRGVTVSMTR